MKKSRSVQPGLIIAAVLGISLLLWSSWRSPSLLAQSPPTPITGYIEIDPHYPNPPTPTPTRIPDNTPPQTTMVIEPTPNLNNWHQTPISLTFTATDDLTGLGLTWHKFTTETAWRKYEYYYPPVVISAEGVYTVSYYSADKNFNIETLQTTALKIDMTAPVATYTLTGNLTLEGWYTPPVTVSVTGQDNLSGLDRYEMNVNNKGWLVIETQAISVAGQHRIEYRAIDRAGNVSLPGALTVNIQENSTRYYLPLILKTG